MPEHQTIEWKESWHDEFLEWICDMQMLMAEHFIQAKTTTEMLLDLAIKIGKLLESIPNEITDIMGIVVDVNLLYENALRYFKIVVDKYLSLISYRGKYFYRLGSTMRMITGKELDKTILKSQGRT